MHYEADLHLRSGDFGVSRWRLTGTSTTGQRVDVQGCDLYELRGQKVVRKDSYWKISEP